MTQKTLVAGRLYLSRKKLDKLSLSSQASQPEMSVAMREKNTILLVDDEELVRDVVQTMLSDAGYRVISVADGHAAIEQYQAHSCEIDLVLLDYEMPGMSGFAVVDHISRLDPQARIIICSGYDSEQRSHAMALPNIIGRINKPFNKDELIERVDHFLE